jgi:hypothetical protein
MAIYQEKTQMTQRPLTAAELEDARAAYNAVGKLYPATHAATELVAASDYLRRMITERTTDGKPLRSERVPTAADIGKQWPEYDHDPQPQADAVNHPPHYTAGEIECIDAIRAALGREGFIAYCRGNVIKYVWRCVHKGGVEDLKKAKWYQEKAIKEAGECE